MVVNMIMRTTGTIPPKKKEGKIMKYIIDIDALKDCLKLLPAYRINGLDHVDLNDVWEMINRFPKEEYDDKTEYGHWIYWDGWIGNSSQRIDDATCSECGYKHPTVCWTNGDRHNSTPDKLADICPNCKTTMRKWKTTI